VICLKSYEVTPLLPILKVSFPVQERQREEDKKKAAAKPGEFAAALKKAMEGRTWKSQDLVGGPGRRVQYHLYDGRR
jgi:hypothetical protein